MLSVATAIAIVVAIASFIALKPSGDGSIPRDAYTISADRLCVASKRQIVATEGQALRHPGGDDPGGFSALVPIVSSWRSEFESMPVPTDRIDQGHALAIALREVEIAISELALVAKSGDRARTVARAKQVDSVTGQVEEAVAALNLAQCARDTIGFPRPPAN